MEANTRVKKYEDLRETLLKENQEVQETPKLSRFAKRLSNIDADYFQPIVESYEKDAKKEIAVPQRAMSSEDAPQENDEYFNEQEILSRALRLTSQNQESSDDELLNQFLKEIRSYNQKQGVRSVDDTRMEILKQVKVEAEEVEKPVKKVEEKEELKEENPARFSIAKQVKDMLKTQDLKIGFDEEEEVEPKKKEKKLSHTSERYLQSLDEDRASRAKILEETQQLRLKLNEHEDELDEIGTGIDYTRKLLNVLLGLLMVTVLIAGGILAYLIMRGSFVHKINIAIDGPSAAGKSTLAKALAKKLNYVHLDTGAMYRCVAYKAKCNDISWDEEALLVEMLQTTKIELLPNGSIYLDGNDVSLAIRQNEISLGASNVSKHPLVRSELVKRQQEMAQQKGFVMDGRDIGTVVLPDAEVKIFQTASAKTRAMRRYKENLNKGIESNLEQLEEEIKQRDIQDSTRAASPLRQAEDAILFDTSALSEEEAINKMLEYVNKVIN